MRQVWIVLIVILALVLAYVFVNRVTFSDYKAKTVCFSKTNEPIIFVPGLKGSLLEEDAKTVWLKLRHGLRNTTPLTYTGTLKATGLFRIGPYKPYRRISKEMACRGGYVYYYDWRDYPQKNADGFAQLVERVTKETGKKPHVIAHSMGGLIVHGYLKDNPEKLDKVVYVSVPFVPGVGYFDDLNNGTSVGRNKQIMGKVAIASQPASYLLLPHFGSDMYAGVELLDAKTWKDNKFGVYKDADFDLDKLQAMMNEIKKYHNKLDQPVTLTNKFLIVTSDCHETVLKIDKSGQRSYVPGDGRVSQLSSYPLDDLPNMQKAVFCQTHEGQLQDRKILNAIFTFLESKYFI